MAFVKQKTIKDEVVNIWMLDIPLPGPFGYSTEIASGSPRSFWFPVISGWVQQDFKDYSSEAPSTENFSIPESCKLKPSVGIPIAFQKILFSSSRILKKKR